MIRTVSNKYTLVKLVLRSDPRTLIFRIEAIYNTRKCVPRT